MDFGFWSFPGEVSILIYIFGLAKNPDPNSNDRLISRSLPTSPKKLPEKTSGLQTGIGFVFRSSDAAAKDFCFFLNASMRILSLSAVDMSVFLGRENWLVSGRTFGDFSWKNLNSSTFFRPCF